MTFQRARLIHHLSRRPYFVVALILLASALAFAFPWANRAFAQQLIATSSVLGSGISIEPGQARHYFYTTYTRLPETIPDLPDSYHLPATTFFTANQTTEIWQTQIGDAPAFHSITRAQTANGGNQVLYEVISRIDGQWFYDASAGMALQSVTEDVEAERETQASRQAEDRARLDRSSDVVGITMHEGRPAWVVQFEQQPATPQEYAFSPGSYTSPFAADLDFSAVQARWLIDQATGLIATQELWALTTPKPTLLSRTTQSEIEVIAEAAAVPMDRFITTEAQSLLEANRLNLRH